LYKQKQLVPNGGWDLGANGGWIYGFLLRADLLNQKLDELPSSYVSLASCYGSYFNNIFINHGAKVFNSWDEKVSPESADGNVKTILGLMVEHSYSSVKAYQDDAVVKTDRKWGADFITYPSITNMATDYYLPAWISKITVNTSENATLKVSLLDSTSKLLMFKDVKAASSSVVAEGFDKILLPATETVTIAVEVIGNSAKANTTNYTLSAGSNSCEITLGDLPAYDYAELQLIETALINVQADTHQVPTATAPTNDMSAFPTAPAPLYPKYIPIKNTKFLYSCDEYGWVTQHSLDGTAVLGGRPK
jgi:hypothetical protein